LLGGEDLRDRRVGGPDAAGRRNSEFAADPVRTLEAVYAHFGLPLTGVARAAMKALRRHSAPAAVGPAHRYALSDFGLTDRQVGERFAGYR
jgi:hypothetical protein